LSLEESQTVRKGAEASRILPGRFLYRDKKHVKRKIDPEGGCTPKATRLCVGGQRDPDLKVRELAVDAPTASRHSVLIGLQLIEILIRVEILIEKNQDSVNDQNWRSRTKRKPLNGHRSACHHSWVKTFCARHDEVTNRRKYRNSLEA
jgi:hypothetical protein